MDWAEACRILGVSESATDIEIKEQYIYKAQLLHPDKNQDKPENIRRKAEAELALINQAYTFLNNPNNNPYKMPPKLAVEPMAIRFKDVDIGERKKTTLIIRNIGGPYTSVWIDNQPAPWLTVTGVKSITSERLPLEVVLECTGIGEPGDRYTCDLLIKLENENTHVVDRAIVKIEIFIKSQSIKAGTGKEARDSAKSSTIGVSQNNSTPQPVEVKKTRFSPGGFILNLLAFAVVGAVLVFLVSIFLEIDAMVLIIALIIYAAIALGVSINHGFRVGSKAEKTETKKQNNNPTT